MITSTQVIQSILAPAVMISSSGLFFLGLNARQSSVLTRIRLLNDEKRKLVKEIYGVEHARCDDRRCVSVDHQLNALVRRAWYIRNSIIFHTMAVAFFVLTSFAIALTLLISNVWLNQVPLLLFITGMGLVLAGIISLGIDEYLSYSVILIEVKKEA